jgi:hypothetical protein
MKELDDLVNSQFVIPKFSTRNIEMFWGEEKTFTDLNGVLSNYEIANGDNVEGSINGNQLTIKSNYYGTSYIIFKKTRKRFSNKPIVYINDTSQNLLLPGYLYDVSDRISIKMNYGTISVQKLDSQTKDTTPNHQGSLENAKYGLYSNDGNLLEEKYTNSNGKLTFDTKLNSNNYYIQEISPSNGYLLDSTKYNVNINKDNYIVTKNVYEQVIKENYEIIKILENNKTGLVEFEKGVEFGIYDLNNNLINTYVTDDFGTIKFSLDYGKYIIKQHTSYANYEKIEDFEIEVKENNKNNKYIFQDNKIIYKVKLTVKDKETNDTIKDINFELYDNEKICINEENCIYTTDENGEINFSNNFDFNDYVIKLITDEKFKYIYDDDTIKFTIDENTEYKEIENYRLVELEYFLQLKKENKIIIEDNQDYDISYNEEEIEENIDEENTNSISQDEDMLVEVPNTLANDNYLNLITLVTISIIIKKYFK